MKPSNPIDWDDTRCRIPREARNPAQTKAAGAGGMPGLMLFAGPAAQD